MSSSSPRSHWIIFGEHDPSFAGQEGWLGLLLSEFNNHHIRVSGLTGFGKSRYLAGLALTLLNAGQSVFLIDPNGDLAKLILLYLVAGGAFSDPVSPWYQKILYLDLPEAEKQDRYLPFNVLNQPYRPHVIARSVVEAMRRTWSDIGEGQAVGMENVFLMGISLLLEHNLPLPLLRDVLTNKPFRERLLMTTTNADVLTFFRTRYERWGQDQTRNIESPLRRLLLFTFSPILRYSLVQQTNLLDFRLLLKEQRSVIVNLALNDIDEKRLLGCLLTVYIEQAIMARSDIPPQERTSCHLILDEFSQFSATSGEALNNILNMARKYGMSLVLASQTRSQLSPKLLGALQNCGIEVTFRIGREDAEVSAKVFGKVSPLAIKHDVIDPLQQAKSHPQFYSLAEQWEAWTQVLTELGSREALVKLKDNQVSKVRTLAVPDVAVDVAQLRAVEEYYLQTLFQPKDEIEQEVSRWLGRSSPADTELMGESVSQGDDDDDILRD